MKKKKLRKRAVSSGEVGVGLVSCGSPSWLLVASRAAGHCTGCRPWFKIMISTSSNGKDKCSFERLRCVFRIIRKYLDVDSLCLSLNAKTTSSFLSWLNFSTLR